ncbi:MAG: 1-(5-phosphoribosyl)-5-[(5-phosphoribosylamino)methylideneamino] imidazole-4-carboxamide isomerase [Gemmatimonadota bacterium]
MIVTPAVDVKGGRCVQLVGGRPEDERVSLPDPPSVASDWWERGFASLHVVDLDAALGSGTNDALVGQVLSATKADTQVGGGVRSTERATELLAAGATRVVVGTRALDNPVWLAELAEAHPDRIVVALDTREGIVLRKGWTEASNLRATELAVRLAELPLAGILSTDVGREGRLEGIDLGGCRAIIDASRHPVWISGGITSVDDLAVLEGIGAYGAVLGMTLYTHTIDVDVVASRWGGAPSESDQGASP